MWLAPLGLSLLDVSKNGVRIVVHEYDGRRNQAEEQAERERREAAKNQTCDKG
ncbi:hypothetical protein [Streptomyces coffeae]|uniref:hypothetical protein n=1 Tax=Streptomyces coffeae TaxID=621382 RepID=UPI001F170E6B|nr:hypothetical protein [Streptomyces coffeae]